MRKIDTQVPATRDLPEARARTEVGEHPEETDWKKAFQALAFLSSTEFVSSNHVANRTNKIREVCGDEPAEFFFNSTRSQWMQDFMG